MKRVIASIVVAASILAGLTTDAEATFDNGNKLLGTCQNESEIPWGYCLGYIVGIAEVLETEPLVGMGACLPKTATKGQLRIIVIKWLEANPQHLHFSAHSLVVKALSKAFPCKN